jgi:uncharacterized membrane protein YdjX (TVP38/TMEM64 family)
MSARNTFLFLFLLLSALILVSFFIWGSGFDALFSLDGSTRFFDSHARLAGPLGAGLLIADLVLPIPSTGVLGGMGAVLGAGPAFLWGWSGLVLSGSCGYAAARWGGTRWAAKLAPEEERERYKDLFNTWGSLAIVITRLLPVLPEVLSVLSGLYGMKFSRFFGATLVGSLAPALAYTWLGAQAREHPGPAIWGIVLLTALAWLAFLYLHRCARTA